jgi:hypothetical protein
MADQRPGPAAPRPRPAAPTRTTPPTRTAPPTRTVAPAAPPEPQAAKPAKPAKPGKTATVPAPEPEGPPPPSLGELVANASQQMSVLVRSEIELAKLELKVEAKKAAIGAVGFGAAAFLGLFALLMLSFAAAYGINSLGLAKGWSFLIVGGSYLLLAGVLALTGLKSVTKIGPPKRTLKTTKETVAALKEVGRTAGRRAPEEAGA